LTRTYGQAYWPQLFVRDEHLAVDDGLEATGFADDAPVPGFDGRTPEENHQLTLYL
jgi:hypothetical protein